MDSLNELLAKGTLSRGIEDAFLRNLARITFEISSLADELDDLDEDISEAAQSLKSTTWNPETQP